MPDSTSPIHTVQVVDSLYQEWYDDKYIIGYRLEDFSPDILKKWTAVAVDEIKSWSRERPYLALHDLSYRGVVMKLTAMRNSLLNLAVTEDGLDQVEKVITPESGFKAYVALIVSVQFSGYLASTFATLEAHRHYRQNVEYRVFSERVAALTWLRDKIEPQQTDASSSTTSIEDTPVEE